LCILKALRRKYLVKWRERWRSGSRAGRDLFIKPSSAPSRIAIKLFT
jgi:hypothetical protein